MQARSGRVGWAKQQGKGVNEMFGQDENGGPINHSGEWIGAIYACLNAIRDALPQGTVPTKEAAEAARLLAEAAAKLTFG